MYPKNLEEKVENNYNVTCISKGKDRYGRILGICGFDFLGANSINFSLNAFMVKMGHAVAYKKYSKMFEHLENEAKEKSRGIWSGKFERPQDWRKNNKTKKSKIKISLPPFVIIRYTLINEKKYYHLFIIFFYFILYVNSKKSIKCMQHFF